MQHKTFAATLGLCAGVLAVGAGVSNAAVCANGVYRAGCAGPNGAAVVHKAPTPAVTCANGVYRAGCVGPNGAAVAHKGYVAPHAVVATPPVPCRYVNGVRVCR
jgi:hypothetical protein